VVIPIQALTIREFEVDPKGNLIKAAPKKGEKEKTSVAAKKKSNGKEFQGVLLCVTES